MGALGRAWIVGVFAFSVARALVAWPTLGRYGVNPWVFLAIDVATAYPYAVGQVKIVNGWRLRAWRAVQWWIAVVTASFLAPYLYIVGAGSGELPWFVYLVIGVLVVVFGLVQIKRMRHSYQTTSVAAQLPRLSL